MAREVMIREALESGWETLRSRPGPLLRLQAVTVALGFGPLALGEIIPGDLGYLFMLAGSLLQSVMALGWARIALKLAAGEEAAAGDLFAEWRRFPVFLAAAFLAYIPVLVGLVCLVAPGAFLLTAWCLFPFTLVAERTGPVRSLLRSWSLTAGARWQLLGLVLLSLLLLAAGLVACGFGVFLSAPVVAVAWGRVYRGLAADAGA